MKEIDDNEIRVIGKDGKSVRSSRHLRLWVWVAMGIVVVGIILLILPKGNRNVLNGTEPNPEVSAVSPYVWQENIDANLRSATYVQDTTIDSITMHILTPYNAIPELHVGALQPTDKDIVFASMAADIRRDNGKIVGAFILAGEPQSWGLSKKGYCAIIEDRITIGTAENSPLFELATEKGGYFFRQYPAVSEGKPIKNNPENRSYRRALCRYDGKVCIIYCDERVLMDDFSKALSRLGVEEGIFLVGSTAPMWYSDNKGEMHDIFTIEGQQAKYINYIVFRKP